VQGFENMHHLYFKTTKLLLVMKSITSHIKTLLSAAALIILAASCSDKVVQEYTYTVNSPIYMSHEEFNNRVIASEPRALETPGKLHFKDNMIYIVEQYKGIHVINNSDPASPQFVSFIEMPGVVDIASKGYTMYADSYTDLVALDISDPNQVREVGREPNVFSQNTGFWSSLPPTENDYPIGQIDPTQGVIIGWKVETITEEYEVDNRGWGCYNCEYLSTTNDMAVGSGASPTASSPSGVSGSMARFAVSENALYVLDIWTLKALDITNATDPVMGETFQTNLQVETLFPMDDKLFVGTTTGMMIYDISNAMSPSFITTFTHANSCDPVVVEGNTAYVTLRSGNSCQGFENQLDVIDVTDFENPTLIQTYPMTNPHGLGIDNGTLFICDGDDGLKVYDASNPNAIDQNQLSHFQDINTYDVIPLGNVLLMIGADGFYQYDYTDVQDIKLLSVIPVVL
jgi:hypothetical protein